MGFPGAEVVKNLPANAGDAGDVGSIPGWGRFPWRKKWQLDPVFLPGKSHGQRSLVGCSPWGWEESHMTERPSTHQVYMWLHRALDPREITASVLSIPDLHALEEGLPHFLRWLYDMIKDILGLKLMLKWLRLWGMLGCDKYIWHEFSGTGKLLCVKFPESHVQALTPESCACDLTWGHDYCGFD